VGIKRLHFLDSGAFSQLTLSIEYAKEHNCKRWKYYRTKEFKEYMDGYAAFIKKYKKGIDYYTNLDVIHNPKLTWKNQQYLEKEHGLSPVPVVHFNSDSKQLYKIGLHWLGHYIDHGYEMIGLGGIAKEATRSEGTRWFDACFNLICDKDTRLPQVKIHGFGVSSVKWWLRYPWYSIDSTSIYKKAGYGWILVPRKKGDSFDFTQPPFHVKISDASSFIDVWGKYYDAYSEDSERKKNIDDWLKYINVPLGHAAQVGVRNDWTYRVIANYCYYDLMFKTLPEWPWPFGIKIPQTLKDQEESL